jgi:integrase/recombinase XerD
MLLKKYKEYLEEKGMNPQNVRQLVNQVERWKDWLGKEVEKSDYGDLMDYIKSLQEANKSPNQINRILQGISHYYTCFGLRNVAIGTRIRGMVEKARLSVFTEDELDEMYQKYEVKEGKGYCFYSDKLILGMMIYQGLELGDFMKIEVKDVDLEKGKLYVPERGYKKSRKLGLEAHQILQLYHYIYVDRNKFSNQESEKLLSPQGDKYNDLHWQYKKLSTEFKRQMKERCGKEVVKLSQLRQSRITLWIKQYGLRKAQYMAGFRRVLSIERYRDPNLENLKSEVNKYHPW